MKNSEFINVTVNLNGSQNHKKIEKGTSVLELIESLEYVPNHKIVAAKVNNHMIELISLLTEDCRIDFIDLSDIDGNRIYQRSISFVLVKAAREILGNCDVLIEHSLSKGLYCEIKCQRDIDEDDIKAIKQRMQEIVDSDIPFVKEQVSVEEAMKIFREQDMESQVKILKFTQKEYIHIYSCGGLKNYFYGYMVPSTGYVDIFDLIPYKSGVILRFPQKEDPDRLPKFYEQRKLAEVFKESEDWGKLMGLAYVSDLNERIETETYENIIRIAEALHEKKIAFIADKIHKEKKRLILIAGPSSSGKTSFAQRLAVQMRVNGLDPIAFSTDDYFLERHQTPKDKNGEYDFESLDALDLDLFNKHLEDLIEGKEVDIPSFNFLTGQKEFGNRIIKVFSNQPIIIEGIHGLNDKLTQKISNDKKFKIYISALTQINIDSHNRIPTTDSRLIRRMVRDNLFRGHSAKMTLKIWASVRKGEEKNIFPFQEEADVMFNSVLVYELAVLKKYAEPLLREINEKDESYIEAKRLLRFLGYFLSIDDECAILNNSIIKEFTGGSCFFK